MGVRSRVPPALSSTRRQGSCRGTEGTVDRYETPLRSRSEPTGETARLEPQLGTRVCLAVTQFDRRGDVVVSLFVSIDGDDDARD